MLPRNSIIIYGFALFAMFFGSGNLVFPLKIGSMLGSQWLIGFLGLFISGIILPFCGLFVIKLHKGNYENFFKEAGLLAQKVLPLFTLSLLGSFGVVPRCISVAHGGINHFLPLSLSIFSLIFITVIYFVCLKEQRIMSIIGKWMSPLLILILFALIIKGISNPLRTDTDIVMPNIKAFYQGFIIGYETMDLFAAFFFSSVIFLQIQTIFNHENSFAQTKKFFIKSSLIGVSVLSLVYLGLVALGHYFSPLLVQQDESMLIIITQHLFGDYSVIIVGIAVLISCFTTAVALISIYTNYLLKLFNLHKDKFKSVLAMNLLISYFVSLFDFKGIALFLVPMLQISYPSIIVLTIFSIFVRGYQNIKKIIFYSVLLFSLLQCFLI